MDCTAPTRGHRTAGGVARCPVHGGHGLAVAPNPAPVPPPAGHQPVAPLAYSPITLMTVSVLVDGLEAVLSGKPATAVKAYQGLVELADQVGPKVAEKHSDKPAHWLCELLADVADAIDPSVATAQMQRALEQLLISDGLHRVIAALISKALEKTLKAAATQLMPHQYALALRVLGILLCPDVDNCPAGDRLANPVLEAIADSGAATAGPKPRSLRVEHVLPCRLIGHIDPAITRAAPTGARVAPRQSTPTRARFLPVKAERPRPLGRGRSHAGGYGSQEAGYISRNRA